MSSDLPCLERRAAASLVNQTISGVSLFPNAVHHPAEHHPAQSDCETGKIETASIVLSSRLAALLY